MCRRCDEVSLRIGACIALIGLAFTEDPLLYPLEAQHFEEGCLSVATRHVKDTKLSFMAMKTCSTEAGQA